MDTDQGKIFVGGISWETSEEKLKEYFSQYGDVLQSVIMVDKITNRPRGFGFVLFADPGVVDNVLRDQHTIDNRTVDVKRALSKEEQTTRGSNGNGSRSTGSVGNVRTKKIFVGGLPPTLTEDGFRQYFEHYGHVTDVVIMYDQNTQRPRGFGFISFDSEEAVERVLHKTFHDLNGKQVEVKCALPKDANPGMSMRSGGGGSGGGYQGYNSSAGNPNAYDGKMESKGYMQSQGAGGAYGHYGASGYGAPGYGYGSAGNGMGYGGYGGYGGANPGYGGHGAAGYGNPNVASAGYGGGPAGAGRSSWNAQNPSGYAAVGYGNPAAWAAAGGGGPGSVSGQSPGGASAYGNQGYGYGNFGGNDGSYGGQGGYGGRGGALPGGNSSGGVAGGEMQGGGGYMGGGYGDANGHSGYGGAGWRSDQAAGNYGA